MADNIMTADLGGAAPPSLLSANAPQTGMIPQALPSPMMAPEWIPRQVAPMSFAAAFPSIVAEDQPVAILQRIAQVPKPSGPMMTADDANKLAGEKLWSEPVAENVARYTIDQRAQAQQRKNIVAQFDQDHTWYESFGAHTLAFMTDPVGAVSSVFGPGEEALAARLGGSLAARVGARAIVGGAVGGGVQAGVSGIQLAEAQTHVTDYALKDALHDVAFGAAFGGIMHVGIGGIIGPGAEHYARPEEPYAAPPGASAQGKENPEPLTVGMPAPVADIAADVARKLTDAGRSSEEAKAAGEIVASIYRARAERFGGGAGTAEEMYGRDGTKIVLGGVKKGGEYEQGGYGEFKPVDTKSPEFNEWFGDSQVKGDSGEPLTLYHGSKYGDVSNENWEFNHENGGYDETPSSAYYFTNDEDSAIDYAGNDRDAVLKVFLRAENVLDLTTKDGIERLNHSINTGGRYSPLAGVDFDGEADFHTNSSLFHQMEDISDGNPNEWMNFITDWADRQGYDGVKFLDAIREGTSTSYVVFNPEQVKSAVSNTGDFSLEDPRIMYQRQNDKARGDDAGIERRKDGEISSLHDLIDKIRANDGELHVRWSKGPRYDMQPGARSIDYQTGMAHKGLSAVPIGDDSDIIQLIRYLREYEYLSQRGVNVHIYKGEKVGTDSDGYDSIRPSDYIGALSPRLKKFVTSEDTMQRLKLMQNEIMLRTRVSSREAAKARGEDIGWYAEETLPIEREELEDTRSKINALKKPTKWENDQLSLLHVEGYEQRNLPRGPVQGMAFLDGGQKIIHLLQAADASTFMHETAHVWLDQLKSDSTHPQATDATRKAWTDVKDWLKVGEDDALTRLQHEEFARSFERYLHTGEAPTSRLKAAFDQFKAWLQQIYQAGKGLPKISADVKDMFDRLISPESERSLPVLADAVPLRPSDHMDMVKAHIAALTTDAPYQVGHGIRSIAAIQQAEDDLGVFVRRQARISAQAEMEARAQAEHEQAVRTHAEQVESLKSQLQPILDARDEATESLRAEQTALEDHLVKVSAAGDLYGLGPKIDETAQSLSSARAARAAVDADIESLRQQYVSGAVDLENRMKSAQAEHLKQAGALDAAAQQIPHGAEDIEDRIAGHTQRAAELDEEAAQYHNTADRLDAIYAELARSPAAARRAELQRERDIITASPGRGLNDIASDKVDELAAIKAAQAEAAARDAARGEAKAAIAQHERAGIAAEETHAAAIEGHEKATAGLKAELIDKADRLDREIAAHEHNFSDMKERADALRSIGAAVPDPLWEGRSVAEIKAAKSDLSRIQRQINALQKRIATAEGRAPNALSGLDVPLEARAASAAAKQAALEENTAHALRRVAGTMQRELSRADALELAKAVLSGELKPAEVAELIGHMQHDIRGAADAIRQAGAEARWGIAETIAQYRAAMAPAREAIAEDAVRAVRDADSLSPVPAAEATPKGQGTKEGQGGTKTGQPATLTGEAPETAVAESPAVRQAMTDGDVYAAQLGDLSDAARAEIAAADAGVDRAQRMADGFRAAAQCLLANGG